MLEFIKSVFSNTKEISVPKYEQVTIGNDGSYEHFQDLVAKNRELLKLNGVKTSKIRFVFGPTFTYDPDRDIINPKYDIMIPKGGVDYPPIELPNKPKRLLKGVVNSYKFEDNYEFINEAVKKSKRGIVIFLHEKEIVKGLRGESHEYGFSVDSEELRLRDLDEICEVLENTDPIL